MEQNNLFNNLKRLFASDTVIRNIGGDQIKVADINRIQATGKYKTNSVVGRYAKVYKNNRSNIYSPTQNQQAVRGQLYSDYEAMDTDPILASTLDILADESTLKNDEGEVLAINSSDENVQRVLYNLFYDVLNIEFNLWSWIRNVCKHGDFFLKLEIAEKFGVYNVIPYTVYFMSRHEGLNPDNPTETVFELNLDGLAASPRGTSYQSTRQKSETIQYFDNYEIAHFRLIADTNHLPYGRSYLEPARKIYKELVMMEDAMLLHRIMRAPEKRMFYINVGHIPANEVEQYMEDTVSELKKTPHIDPETGNYNLRFNIQNMMEDFYLPVRGGDTSTRIETTKGLEYDGIKDVEYLLQKMFAALKVPKAYFGYEGDLSGKATLAAEDIRFARTVERIQTITEAELTRIAIVHLYAQGFRGESLTNFEIRLTSPSIIFEQEKVALLKEKIGLAEDMLRTGLFPSDYVYEKLFNLSETSYAEFRRLVVEDKKRGFRLEQIDKEGNDPSESGRSYGTPHDLATMYGRRVGQGEKGPILGEVPAGYEDHPNPPQDKKTGPEGGRPKERDSIIGTNAASMGRDPIGTHGMKGGFKSDNENVNEGYTITKTGQIALKENNNLERLEKALVYKRVNKEEDTVGILKEDSLLSKGE